MEVSTFELLFKPQAPTAPVGVAAVDRVIQGYFLKITNLETQTLSFQLDFVAPVATDPSRSLTGNTLVFVDVPEVDNQQGVLANPVGEDPSIFRPTTGPVTIPAAATALVAVLPSAFGPLPGEPTPLVVPDFEVRGFVRIGLPPMLGISPEGVVSFVAQSEMPVRVLLTPQNRATFLAADNSISDQTQTAVPTAGGGALAVIEPEPGGPILGDVFPVAPEAMPDVAPLLAPLTPMQRAAAFQTMLAGIDTATFDLAGFNRDLKKAGIPIALERRATETKTAKV